MQYENFYVPEGIAYQQSCSIFRGEINLENPYFMYNVKKYSTERRLRKVREEGVYVFGGKNMAGDAIGTLAVLRVGVKPL